MVDPDLVASAETKSCVDDAYSVHERADAAGSNCPSSCIVPLGRSPRRSPVLHYASGQWQVAATADQECILLGGLPERGRTEASPALTLAAATEVIATRYIDGHPARLQRQAISAAYPALSRSTLAAWTGQIAELLEPVADVLRRSALNAPGITADCAPLPIDGIQSARIWAYVATWPQSKGGEAGRQLAWIKVTPDRVGRYADQQLADYAGSLVLPPEPAFQRLCTRDDVIIHANKMQVAALVRAAGFANPHHLLSCFDRLLTAVVTVEEKRRGVAFRSQAVDDRSQLELLPVLRELQDALEGRQRPGTLVPQAATALRQLRLLLRGIEMRLAGAATVRFNSATSILSSVRSQSTSWIFGRLAETHHHAATVLTLTESCRLSSVDPRAYLSGILLTLCSGRSTTTVEEEAWMPWRMVPQDRLVRMRTTV